MLDLKYILNNKAEVIKKLSTRNYDVTKIDSIVKLGEKRGKLIHQLEQLQAQRNSLSETIGIKKRNKEACDDLMEAVNKIKAEIDSVDHRADAIIKQVNDILVLIPNLPYDEVPVGYDENDNVLIARHDQLGRGLVKGVEAHYDIATKLNIIDFSRAVKMAHTRFVAYKNDGARLIRALANFMLDTHIKNGYKEIMPAHLVNSAMLFGTGQLPKFKEDLFKVNNDDLWLIPTAEVPLTNFHHDEIVDLSEPIKYVAYTKCFRSEAGSGGKDTRGIIRQHEFHKVELVKLVKQEDAMKEWEAMVKDAKNILELLEIPYQELLLCTGDMGFSSAKTIDLELWIPSEQRFRETSSISICTDFQARRAKIRYKTADGKTQFAYTMNGSGLAIDRVMAAILENYQNPDGSITIPKVLVPYMNNQTIIK
ncbi:seryl-tRNA synthetase [Metamycoplasma cloacale]|uniref:Serine--tRNA ligase n=1 Tax=Metamycoplasma cloacale TaxID=92401 RepID=A0A2Z4LMQ9_9BACT|nr:serine--tRNA ligase [Metamycoplasma cloacale]AWX42527.1 serine--tRNA ligase [Metamycoplasma cloacale]VEU79127.1 seryl-tRNA synthetase [Metamycoplasma cloacale]